jgi:hypothetical protein
MAKNWTEAQAKEKAFWTRIYVEKQADIRSHMPIDTRSRRLPHKTRPPPPASVDAPTQDVDISPGRNILYGLRHSSERFAARRR